MNISTKLKVSASKTATSPSCKTLGASFEKQIAMRTVAEVIRRGERVRIFSLLPICLVIPLIIVVGVYGFSFYFFLFGFHSTLFLTLMCYNYGIHRWRVWALSNVDSPAEFRIRAEELYLIPQSKIIDKNEFNSKSYVEEWEKLQTRFLEKETELNLDNFFVEGLEIKVSVWKIILHYGILFFLYSSKRILINSSCILVDGKQVYEWEFIKSEAIKLHYDYLNFDGRVYVLEFDFKGREIAIPLELYSINPLRFSRILKAIRRQLNANKPAPNIALAGNSGDFAQNNVL